MKHLKLKNLLVINSFFFLFHNLFFIFPKSDIYFSNLFFENSLFISEKYSLIKTLRSFLKDYGFNSHYFALILLFYYSKRSNKGNKLNKG